MSLSQSSGTLVSTEGRTLPLTHAHADIDAVDGLARVVLRQRFENSHDLPLEILYSLPLPAEAAVSGFAFTIGERRIVGEIDRKSRARERYEEALVLGNTAALVEQERDTLFTQRLGNVPPHTAIDAEIVLDLALRYLDDGSYELRLPTTVAPRYLGEPGRVADADVIAQHVSREKMPVRFTIEAHVRGAASEVVESTTHAVRSDAIAGAVVARFVEEHGVALDRDVVLRWRVARKTAAIDVRVTRPRGSDTAYAMLTLTPPLVSPAALPRDLVLLLDTSGSMGGLPIEQAKRISLALVASMSEVDTLEMISFSSSPSRWKRGTTRMDGAGRAAASQWIAGLRASGGTEMRDAILEALAPLREGAQRQVVLVTDGQIGFETEIVAAILQRLPAGSRVHAVGVGSGINRTLTAGAARAGRGVEVLADLDEDAERAVFRIVARTKAPLVTELSLRGDVLRRVAPQRLPDLFATSPAVLTAAVDPKGGTVVVSGRTPQGPWSTELVIPPCEEGTGPFAIEQLHGREVVADHEMQAAAGEHVDKWIEEVGLAHRIATRMTSWIAVSKERDVEPTSPFKTERMPHEVPYGAAAEQFGLRTVAPGPLAPQADALFAMPAMARAPGAPSSLGAAGGAGDEGDGSRATGAPPPPAFMPPPAAAAPKGSFVSRLFGKPAKEKGSREESDKRMAPARERPASRNDDEDSVRTLARSQPRAERILQAKIAVRRDGQIVVIVSAGDEDIEWTMPRTAQLLTRSGKRVPVAVTLAPPSGAFAAGTELRLGLALLGADDGEEIVRVALDNGVILVLD